MELPVLAIVGLSGSGKTRVARALLQALTVRGYRIAAVKHCPHGYQLDRPSSDSARLLAAGAARVFLTSPGQRATIDAVDPDPSLEAIAASLGNIYDLLLAEGFKQSAVPKVLVLGKEALSPQPGQVIATVGEPGMATDAPHYGFEEMDRLADQVQQQLLDRPLERGGVSLVVDGVQVSLGPFASAALAGAVLGFVKALKGAPRNPRTVQLVLDSPEPALHKKSCSGLQSTVDPPRRTVSPPIDAGLRLAYGACRPSASS